MKRANSGLTCIRQRHVTEFLQQLAVRREITHQSLDRLPRSRTRDYVRGRLVEHGILPRRWVTEALTRLTHEANRDIIEWSHS